MLLDGFVLDVGCGPRDVLPAYAISPHDFTYVGLDPLVGTQPREFPFVHGLAEVLPFEDNLFDHVVYASSIDHLLDYNLALHEAARILKPGGRVHIMADVMPTDDVASSKFFRYYDIARRGLTQVVGGIRSLGIGRTIRYVKSIMSLRIPDGAMDYFHVYFPQASEILSSLKANGLVDVRRETVGEWIFMSAQKPK